MPPTKTPTCSTPALRRSAYRDLSRVAARVPNPATGCQRRGSPNARSAAQPSSRPSDLVGSRTCPALRVLLGRCGGPPERLTLRRCAGYRVKVTRHRTLITGGVRSGKSKVAEDLLAAEATVTYLAPGPIPDRATDPDWADRIDAHRARRPAHWATVETTDLATGIGAAPGAILVDCLGTWVAAVVDQLGTWDHPLATWQSRFDLELDALLAAWRAADGPLVAVTNEVGWSVVPEHRSGRTFRDLLGVVNQRVAADSDEVLLVVAGRVLRL